MRITLLVALAAGAAVEVAGVASVQPPTPKRIATLIDRELKTARVPGASYAVVVGTDVLTGSYGVADAERGTRMTPDTLLQLGSVN
jgi:CubicO group peptidase (beta-lactamase class C family)